MKMICPSCGATASAEAWANDPVARETILAIASLPSPLHLATLRYISLFRPTKSSLSWKKALRLTVEIAALVKLGYVSIQGQSDKDCGPAIWAEAMDQMTDRQTAIKRPLKSHSYLRQVAHGLATEYVKKEEQVKEQNCLNRDNSSDETSSMAEIFKKYTQAELDRLPAWYKQKHGL